MVQLTETDNAGNTRVLRVVLSHVGAVYPAWPEAGSGKTGVEVDGTVHWVTESVSDVLDIVK